MEKNKNLSKRTKVILVIIAVFIFALFPRCRLIRDGGSVFYESIGRGMIYTDYDDLAIAPHTTDISEIKRQIEEIMGGTKNTTQNSK